MFRINIIAAQITKKDQFVYSVELNDKRPGHTTSRRNVVAEK